MLKPKTLHQIGMHPLAPRWLKVLCLKMIMRVIVKGIEKRMKSLTPEQREKVNAKMGRMEG